MHNHNGRSFPARPAARESPRCGASAFPAGKPRLTRTPIARRAASRSCPTGTHAAVRDRPRFPGNDQLHSLRGLGAGSSFAGPSSASRPSLPPRARPRACAEIPRSGARPRQDFGRPRPAPRLAHFHQIGRQSFFRVDQIRDQLGNGQPARRCPLRGRRPSLHRPRSCEASGS